MKVWKTATCILLILTLLLSLAVPTFAAEEIFEKGSILIRNTDTVVASDKSFEAYKIMDLRVWIDDSGTPISEQATVPLSLTETYAELYGLDKNAVDFNTAALQMLLQEKNLHRLLSLIHIIPYTGKVIEEGYEFSFMPFGYYIIKDTTIGVYAEPACELMLAKLAPDCVLEPKLHTPTLEVIATDAVGNRLKDVEFTIHGENLKEILVSRDVYTLAENGEYWKLRNGSYTPYAPGSFVDGMLTDKNSYASLTDKYGKETFTERVIAHKEKTVTGLVGNDGIVRFSGLQEGQYAITNTLEPQGYLPVSGAATVTVSHNELTCKFEYEGAVDGEGRVCFLFQMAAPDLSPKTDPNLILKHSLDLAVDISVNYVIPKTLLEGYDMDSLELNVLVPQYKGNTLEETVLETALYSERGEYCYFTLTGLTAVQMNDQLIARLSGRKDGVEYVSPLDTYSVATYALSQLNKRESSSALKTLCANLLRYGAEVQLYKDYRTNALADAHMTSVHKAYSTDPESVIFSNQYLELPNPDGNGFRWIGKGLNLGSRVGLTFRMEQTDPELSSRDWKILVRYRNFEGEQISCEIYKSDLTPVSQGENRVYEFSFDEFTALDLRTVVCVTVYDMNDSALSSDLIYSADTYGNGKTGPLGDVCKALFAYSDSARAFFTALK